MLNNLKQFAANISGELGSEDKASKALGVTAATINKWKHGKTNSIQPEYIRKIAAHLRWSMDQTQFWLYSPAFIPQQECDRVWRDFQRSLKGEPSPVASEGVILQEVRSALDRLYAILEDLEMRSPSSSTIPQSLTRYYQSVLTQRGFDLGDSDQYREFCQVIGLSTASKIALRLKAIATHEAIADSSDLADIGRSLRSLGEQVDFEKLTAILQDKTSIGK